MCLFTSCQQVGNLLCKYKHLSVGTKQLATLTCLSWFGFKPLQAVRLQRRREVEYFFVTKTCSPVMETDGGKCSWIFTVNVSQAIQGSWPAGSLSLIQFSLIPRIIGCQSHTPFIFQSLHPSPSLLFTMRGTEF